MTVFGSPEFCERAAISELSRDEFAGETAPEPATRTALQWLGKWPPLTGRRGAPEAFPPAQPLRGPSCASCPSDVSPAPPPNRAAPPLGTRSTRRTTKNSMRLQDHPHDPMPQHDNIEVQQQPDLILRQPHIGQQLRPMHRKDRFDRFDLHHQRLPNDHIQPIGIRHRHPSMQEIETHLPPERHLRQRQLDRQQFLVRPLQQPRPVRSVNVQSEPKNPIGQRIESHRQPPASPRDNPKPGLTNR